MGWLRSLGAVLAALLISTSLGRADDHYQVYFTRGSAALDDEASGQLLKITDQLILNGTGQVVVTGYSDPAELAGTMDAVELSARRAQAVAAALRRAGLPEPDQLIVTGMGTSNLPVPPQPDDPLGNPGDRVVLIAAP